MAGQSLHPGELHFAIMADRIAAFPKDAAVDDVDRYGDPIRGVVKDVKPGNRVALVILPTEG